MTSVLECGWSHDHRSLRRNKRTKIAPSSCALCNESQFCAMKRTLPSHDHRRLHYFASVFFISCEGRHFGKFVDVRFNHRGFDFQGRNHLVKRLHGEEKITFGRERKQESRRCIRHVSCPPKQGADIKLASATWISAQEMFTVWWCRRTYLPPYCRSRCACVFLYRNGLLNF
jgi:hypothetical protein